MASEEETPTATATPGQTHVSAKQVVTRWHNAAERAEGIKAKMKRRRAAHRISLRRSHSKG